MDLTSIGLFSFAERRMAWIDQRQSVLAQNIANSNTPGFRAQDLSPFASSVAGEAVSLATTTPNQIGAVNAAGTSPVPTRSQGRSPNGNTVVLEDELSKIASTSNDQETVLNIYKKYADLFRKVIGVNG